MDGREETGTVVLVQIAEEGSVRSPGSSYMEKK